MSDKNYYLTAFDFGHPMHIYEDEFTINDRGQRHYSNWRYDDNDVSRDEDTTKRACPMCKMMTTKDGHDPCIANLPGVKFACCGHGQKDAYISFEDGRMIRGVEEVKEAVKELLK